MSFLVDNGIITEKKYGNGFIYILNDNNDFLVTDYKVLQSQDEQRFIKCMKIRYNGKTALYYDINGMRTLEDYLPSLDANSFINVVSNLLRTVIEVQNNGFMSCSSIDSAFNRIYVNGSNLTVAIVYVPVQRQSLMDAASFENDLRSRLIGTIQRYPILQSPTTSSLEKNLSDSSMPLSTISGYMNSRIPDRVEDSLPQRGSVTSAHTQQLKLVSVNAPSRIELIVDQDNYTIGRKPGEVNGLITFNKAIGRVHCRIVRSTHGFKLEDLGSANGTFLNRQKLMPNKPVSINNGDIIRLANTDFKVNLQ